MQKARLFAVMLFVALFATVGVLAQDMVELPEVFPDEYAGEPIVMAGSSTVFPLAQRMGEIWGEQGGEAPSIDSIGSGGGFERFCVAGETDISNASRAIRDSEIESCAEIGRTPIEFRVGTDALTVGVNINETFVEDVTEEELRQIFGAAELWSEVRAEWPEQPILRYIPGTDSGTFDYFVEAIFEGTYEAMEEGEEEIGSPYTEADFMVPDSLDFAEGNLAEAIAAAEAALEADPENEELVSQLDALDEARDAAITRPILSARGASTVQLSENDDVLVQGIQGSENAIGFFGFAYFANNQDIVKALNINGVTPNAESAEDGSYPLARPLFIYSDASIMEQKPQVAAFINFFLTTVNDEIEEVGYFAASDAALNTAREAWMEAVGEGM